MDDLDLLNHLSKLETEVHRVCCNHKQTSIDNLLHDSFLEFGRSGKTYTKTRILEQCSEKKIDFHMWSQDYALQHASESTALLTYRSADISVNGDLSRYSLRSSLWVCIAEEWKLRFHQGTATEAFSKIG